MDATLPTQFARGGVEQGQTEGAGGSLHLPLGVCGANSPVPVKPARRGRCFAVFSVRSHWERLLNELIYFC